MVDVKDIIDNPAIFAYTVTCARCFSLMTYPQFRSLSEIIIFTIVSIFFRRQIQIFLRLTYVFVKMNPVAIIAIIVNLLTARFKSYKTQIVISILLLWFIALFEPGKENQMKNEVSDAILKYTEDYEREIPMKKVSVQDFTMLVKFKLVCSFAMTLIAYVVLQNEKTDLVFFQAGLALFPTQKEVNKTYLLGAIVSLFSISMYFIK